MKKSKIKKGLIYGEGEVIKCLPSNRYRIKLKNGSIILGYLCGNMVRNNIKAMEGDFLTLEFSKNDLTKARIKFRKSQNESF